MANRQYIGARYVPKIVGEWVEDTSYEALTVVTYNFASYTSKVPVPHTVGNPADNPEYWVCTGEYNAQVAQYASQVTEFKRELEGDMSTLETNVTEQLNTTKTELEGELNTTKTEIESYVDSKLPVNTADIVNGAVTSAKLARAERMAVRENSPTLTKNVVVIGDSYVHSDHGRTAFDQVLPTIATNWNCHFYSDSGAAFTFGGAQNHTFNDLVDIGAADLGADGCADIDYVILCGGRNEAGGIGSPTRPSEYLFTAVHNWCINAKAKFPNAKVILFPCLYDWRLPNTNLMRVIQEMNYAARYDKCCVVTGCWSWGTGDIDMFLYPDDIHPSAGGSGIMCRLIYDAVENHNYNTFRTRQDNVGNFGFYLDEGGISIMGEHTFNGANNIMVAHNNLPAWLKYHGNTDWYFAGYNTVANDTHATMCVLNSSGITLAGGTVMPSGNKARVSVKLPYTL